MVRQGFTLIELVIAISIFSIISTASYFFISNVLSANERNESIAEELHQLQKAMRLMQQDFEQLVNRPVRNNFGTIEEALKTESGQGIRFTRQGWPVLPFQTGPRSELVRVQYWLDDDQLMRRYWTTLDQPDDPVMRDMQVLAEVERMAIRFLYQDAQNALRWTETWPNTQQGATDLPLAIEVLLEIPRYGEIRRLFRCPAAV